MFTIGFSKLHVPTNDSARLPLSALDMEWGSHIHGELRIEIAGRVLPYVGYFGEDDCCFNDWAHELASALACFEKSNPATHDSYK